MSKCDKCGEEVEKKNSALKLQELVTGGFSFSFDRHLYPTKNCAGSPSRVKMIEQDADWKAAYQKLITDSE